MSKKPSKRQDMFSVGVTMGAIQADLRATDKYVRSSFKATFAKHDETNRKVAQLQEDVSELKAITAKKRAWGRLANSAREVYQQSGFLKAAFKVLTSKPAITLILGGGLAAKIMNMF